MSEDLIHGDKNGLLVVSLLLQDVSNRRQSQIGFKQC